MVGIIYKFTILAKYKFDGHKPYYVGQHWGSLDDYWGSGSIWDDFLKRMKKDYPTCWKKLIKKEVLYERPCTQLVLDKMEEYFIKKEKSHYSYQLGGCNVLWGTANNFGSGNPAHEEVVRNKMSLKAKERTSKPEVRKFLSEMNIGKKHTKDSKIKISKKLKGRKLSKSHKEKISESLKGRKLSKSHILNMSEAMKGKRHTEEWRKKHSAAMTGNKHPLYGCSFTWINNGERNKRLNINEPIPEGWRIGYLSKVNT